MNTLLAAVANKARHGRLASPRQTMAMGLVFQALATAFGLGAGLAGSVASDPVVRTQAAACSHSLQLPLRALHPLRRHCPGLVVRDGFCQAFAVLHALCQFAEKVVSR